MTTSPDLSPQPDLSETGLLRHAKADFMASLVVFLVALPLCIGIAVAVGVSPARALITGIVGGLIVGIFSGSPLQVSGPAAGLFVILADLLADSQEKYLAEIGKSESDAMAYALVVLGMCSFLAGVIQVGAGQLKLGQWFRAVSPAVIKGMLAGIGILILISQFHVMLDHVAMWNGDKARGAPQLAATIPEAIVKCFSSDTTANHHLAALTGIIAIACFCIWPLIAPPKIKFLPAALIGIVIATAVANIAGLEIQKLQITADFSSEITWPSTAWSTLIMSPNVWVGAVVIALVASAETLLCATAVDQMHKGPRTKYDQELTAQGVGNMICGSLGALPMTGVIVRSSANVNSGAQTRLSTIMHGIWLLIFVVAVPGVLTYIPKSALGALLVFTGFKLVNIRDIKSLWQTSRGEAGIYFATVIMIVCTDLLTGVCVGIALSAVKLLVRFSNLQMELTVSNDQKQAHLQLKGAATFIGLPKLAGQLEDVPPGVELHVDFAHLTYIDHACLDLLMNWARQHENIGGKLIMDWDKLRGRFSSDSPNQTVGGDDNGDDDFLGNVPEQDE